MLSSHYLRAVEYAGAGGVVSDELVERTVRALRDAGDRALSLHAYPLAAGFYERAIALLPGGSPGPRRELLLSLGDALARAGDQERARETFLTAAELARRSGLAEHLARAALGYGGRFIWSRAWGDPHLVPLLEEALALLDDEDGDLRVRLLARRLGDRAALAYALEGRHCANMGPGMVERRRAIADELIAVAEQIEDTERAYAGQEYRFHALLEVGDAATARQAFEAMTRIAEELRQPAQLWFAGVNRAKLALFEGRFDDADGLIRAAFELGQHDWTGGRGAPGLPRLELRPPRRRHGAGPRAAGTGDLRTAGGRGLPALSRDAVVVRHEPAPRGLPLPRRPRRGGRGVRPAAALRTPQRHAATRALPRLGVERPRDPHRDHGPVARCR